MCVRDDARWMCVDALRRERGESERPSDSRGERSRVRCDGFRLDASGGEAPILRGMIAR